MEPIIRQNNPLNSMTGDLYSNLEVENLVITTKDSYSGKRRIEFSMKYQSYDVYTNIATYKWTLTSTGNFSKGDVPYWDTYGHTSYIIVSLNKHIGGGGEEFDEITVYDSRQSNDVVSLFNSGTLEGTVGLKLTSDRYSGTQFHYIADLHAYGYVAMWNSNSDIGATSGHVVDRKIDITSVPSFNDEQNPTINIVNYVKDYSEDMSLQVSIEETTQVVAFRHDIPKASTSYTLELTEEERNVIRRAASDLATNSVRVKFYLTAKIGEDYLEDEVYQFCTIINADPLISATVMRQETSSSALTGDTETLIRYFSNAVYAFEPIPVKGAVIKEAQVVNGSQWNTALSGVFQKVDSGTFSFYAKDSRNNITRETITKPFVEYVHLTCNLDIDAPKTDGELDFTILGKYWNKNFGVADNTLQIQYRFKENDNAFGEWITVENPTIYDYSDEYSVDVHLDGLDYRVLYTFQARAIDKLYTIESNHYPVKTRPIFEWDSNSFKFNVPVTFSDGRYLDYPLDGLVNAMTKTYNCPVTMTAGAKYTDVTGSATICGNILRCNFSAEWNGSGSSGDMANEEVCTFSIVHGGKIAGMLNTCFGNGATGGMASFYTSSVSQTMETLDFTVWCAAKSSLSDFSTYFQVPIMLNLDYFVEETT